MEKYLAFFLALSLSCLLWAAPLEFRLGLTATAPVQENKIGEGEYAHGVAINGLVSETTNEGALREVTFYCARDSQNLYLAAESPLSKYSDIPLTPEDELEFVITMGDGKTIRQKTNASKVVPEGKNWCWEIAIPWKELGGAPVDGDRCRIDLVRHFQSPEEIAHLTLDGGAEVIFDAAAPGLRYGIAIGSPTGTDYKICRWVVTAPETGAANAVHCRAAIESLGNPETLDQFKTPTASAPAVFDLSLTCADNLHRTLTCRIDEGEKTLLQQEYAWNPENGLDWQKKIPDTGFGFGIYPSTGRAKARIYCADMTRIAAYDLVEYIIRDSQGNELQRVQGTLGKFANEAKWELPQLPEGSYTISVEAQKDGKIAWQHTKEFDYKHFVWENNHIGDDRIILPPFRPLQTDQEQNRVEALLTGYGFGETGRVSSVRAEGDEILAAPMNFFLDGTPLPAGKISFDEVADDRVRLTDEVEFDNVDFRFHHEMDYDGMVLTTIDIAPHEPREIQSFYLDMPLKKDVAKLFHSSHWMRRNPSAFIPEEEGVVWRSLAAPHIGIPGNFRSYTWIGGVKKGLCWFGESDAGYSLSKDSSHTEIVREGDQVILRIHVVTEPCLWDKPFQIVMGFQATPVKPQLPNFRRYASVSESGYAAANSIPVASINEVVMWSACDWVRPPDGDYSYVQFLKNCYGKTNEEIESVVDAYIQKHADVIGKDTKLWKSHLGHAARQRARHAHLMITYFNPRQYDTRWPELTTYADEWDMAAFRNIHYDMYAGIPQRSYQDFLLYYMREMVRKGGIDGVYLDNTNETQNYDDMMGPVRELSQGRFSPQYSFLGMRQLVKRAAVMLYQEGRTVDGFPWIVLHDTNCHIIPVMSFGTFGLNWELNYGDKDYQDRFSPGYILTETLGTQAGLAPQVLLQAGGEGKYRDHQVRSALALMFAFDLLDSYPGYGLPAFETLAPTLDIVRNFGYGWPECQVFPSYKENQPVTISPASVRCTVLTKSDEAMVMVGALADDTEFSLNLTGLGFANPVIYDAVSNEKLATGQQTTLPIPWHEFRLLKIQDEK